MDTFLYVAGLREAGRDDALRASRGGLRHLFEVSLGHAVEIAENVAADGALFVARRPGAVALVETARNDAFVVATFGRAGAGAGAILAALARRPAETVVADLAAREGCFGAMIHDRRAGVLRVFGDALGQRTLRWAELDGAFAVAPHDAALAATGLVSTAPDAVSLASLRAVGWSVGDIPLIAGASVVRAGELATLAPARPDGRARASFVVGDMPRRASAATDAPDEIALRYLRRRIDSTSQLEVEIDGGLDSRAALAAAVALREARAITGRARGPAVDMARQICKRAGIRFVPGPETLPGRDALVAAWSRAAVACNGIIDARAFVPADPGVVMLCGDGGIAVGTGRRPLDLRLPERIATGADVPEALREALARRVRTAVRRLANAAPGPDLAIRFDRTQRWGVAAQAIARDPALMRRASPFQSRELLRAVDAAPEAGDLRQALIARTLSHLSGLPVWDAGGPAEPPGALLATALDIVAESGGALLSAPDAVAAGFGTPTWRDLGARRFLRICRDVSDAAWRARVRAEGAADRAAAIPR